MLRIAGIINTQHNCQIIIRRGNCIIGFLNLIYTLNTGRGSQNGTRGLLITVPESLNGARGSLITARESLNTGRGSLKPGQQSPNTGHESLMPGHQPPNAGHEPLNTGNDITKPLFWLLNLIRQEFLCLCHLTRNGNTTGIGNLLYLLTKKLIKNGKK